MAAFIALAASNFGIACLLIGIAGGALIGLIAHNLYK